MHAAGSVPAPLLAWGQQGWSLSPHCRALKRSCRARMASHGAAALSSALQHPSIFKNSWAAGASHAEGANKESICKSLLKAAGFLFICLFFFLFSPFGLVNPPPCKRRSWQGGWVLCTPREGIYGVAAGQRQGRSSGNEPRAGKDNEGIESRS